MHTVHSLICCICICQVSLSSLISAQRQVHNSWWHTAGRPQAIQPCRAGFRSEGFLWIFQGARGPQFISVNFNLSKWGTPGHLGLLSHQGAGTFKGQLVPTLSEGHILTRISHHLEMLVSIHWLLERPKEWLKLPAWHDISPTQCKQHNTISLWPWTAVFCDNKRNKHGNWVSEDSNCITINKLMQIFQIRGDFSKDPTWLSTLTSVSKGDKAQMAGSQAHAFGGFPVRAQVLMETFTQNPSGENVLQKKWFFVQMF